MPAPLATVSVDIDPVDIHLLGYGIKDASEDELVYALALPRLLDAFAAAGVPATFFVVARDAEAQRAALRQLVVRGHEVASHSLTHPAPFAKLPAGRLQHELVESKRRLEAVVGQPVVGFRAPNWDCDAGVLAGLGAAGYRYDASSYPSPFLLAARLLVGGFGTLRSWPFSWRRWPHAIGALHEFPVTVRGPLRMPVYHTLRYRMDGAKFERIVAAHAQSGRPFHYTLHAIDLLGLREDGVDARLARHPGMDLALDRKRTVLDQALGCIVRHFRPLAFREHLAAVAGPATAARGTPP